MLFHSSDDSSAHIWGNILQVSRPRPSTACHALAGWGVVAFATYLIVSILVPPSIVCFDANGF